MRIVIVALLIVMVSLSLSGCDSETNSNDAQLNPSNDSAETPSQPSASLDSDAYLLARSKGQLYRLSALSGDATLLFDFGAYGIEPIGPADVIDTTAFVTSEDNALNAIDVSTGELLWDFFLGEDGGRNAQPTPVVCSNTVCYAMGHTGILFAIDVKNLQVLWQSSFHPNGDTGENVIGTPLLVSGNRIYLGLYSPDNSIFNSPVTPRLLVIDRTSGDVLKDIRYDVALSGAPAISEDTLIVSTYSGVQALDVTDYSVLWEVSGVQATPALIQGNNVIFNVVDQDLQTVPYAQATVSYDLHTGEQRWVADAGRDDYIYTPTSDGERIYSSSIEYFVCFSCKRAHARAIDINTGNEFWTSNLGIAYTPVAAMGTLFYPDLSATPGESGGFGSVDAATGDVRWINTDIDYSEGDFTLVQDGTTYTRTPYPDVVD